MACACAGAAPTAEAPDAHEHGRMSSLSIAQSEDWKACEHSVPEEVCVRCHPELIPSFQAKHDWCAEHAVPESQCLPCHPDLDFSPASPPPPEADVRVIVHDGEDLPALEPEIVAGKFTVFDFRADWCPPCREVDEHLYAKLEKRSDIAVRKLNVVSWESPIAERYLREVPELPHVVIYDPSGRRVAEISGAKLEELDRILGDGP